MNGMVQPTNQNPQSPQNTKYIIMLGILSLLIIILGITNIVVFITKSNGTNNNPNAYDNKTTANEKTTDISNNETTGNNIEALSKTTCANLNGEFSSNGPQQFLNATEYYSCATTDKKLFDIYVFNNSFTESILGNMTLSSAQEAGIGNSTDGMTILDVSTDRYKGYETYSNGYLFLAGFNNLAVEFHTENMDQANTLLHDFGYPE